MIRPGLTALIGAVLAVPVAADDFYKWKDENGVTHYTLQRPRDRESSTVRVVGRRPVSGASETVTTEVTTTVETTQAEPTSPAPPTKLAPKAEEMLAARKANCDNARTNAETLRSYNRVTLDKDGDGVPETLTEEEHRAELDRAEQQIETYCDEKN